MPKNKDNQKSGSKSSMGNTPDREFESPSKNPSSGKADPGKQAGGSGKGTGPQENMDDEDIDTSGGRKGSFSDKDRGNESQWSPGSSGGSSDR